MTYNTNCPLCDKKVAAHTMLSDAELRQAFDTDADIEVMHLTENAGDHKWTLNQQEREHLWRLLAG